MGLKATTDKGRFRALGIRRALPDPRWKTSGNFVRLKNFDDYVERVFGFRRSPGRDPVSSGFAREPSDSYSALPFPIAKRRSPSVLAGA